MILAGDTVRAVISKAAESTTLCTVGRQLGPVNMRGGVKNSFWKIISVEDIAKRTKDASLRDTNIYSNKEERAPST